MKETKHASDRSERRQLFLDSPNTRRGVVRKLLAASAAFATGIVVSGRAHASDPCGCDSNCVPSGTQCIKSHGLCWHPDYEAYVYLYAVRNGSPAGGCCVDPGGFVCSYACQFSPVC
jgi:hypothetical protein